MASILNKLVHLGSIKVSFTGVPEGALYTVDNDSDASLYG